MEYRILGPLEVYDGERPVLLPGPRQRALLAALLLHPNEVVSEERLLDELWGADQPGSGKAAVRVRVSQLRKALAGDRRVLLTRAPGYMLNVEPEELDSLRFERLLAEGRSALAEGSAELAAAILGDALRLWRGPPLADLSYEEFAQGEIARLGELRLSALEERIEAELELGRHAQLVGELERLLVEQPLRERLRRQHMLALYRSGRQADALAAYRETRRVLLDGLGLEPSRALQELEQAMLRQDPSLDPPPAPAELGDPAAGQPHEERKLVTVLAAVLGASPALRVDDPERAGALLERLQDALAVEIDEAGGRVEAFGGGSLTAVFGAPVAQEDHAERALHAAIAIRRRLGESFGDGLELGLGVATGDAVVDGRHASIGRPVAAALRFAHAAAPGEVLVGGRAAAAARSGFEFGTSAGSHGGRTLLRALSVTRPHGGHTRFVGRGNELDVLLAAYRRAADGGRPHLVTVAGDAGVGKSRLVRELWDRLAAESPEPLRRTGRCASSGRGTTYRALADVLREELGLLETDTPETVQRRLAGREILGLTLGLDVAADLHPLTAREHLHAKWVAFLTELTAERPVVLLVEDLHWAQDPLLELLERLVAQVQGPLLLVGTARPELGSTRPSWGRRHDATSVWLEPLEDDDALLLLGSLGDLELSEAACARVVERAEGNPFFLEELCECLPDEREGERMPDSVQAVLAARIDLLPPVEKQALQAASVIGRIFWRGPVRTLLGGETPDFAVLETRDFIRRRLSSTLAGEREFTFKHALTRDVAYATLPKARRARLHAAFAGWLEETGGSRDEHAGLLAHHYLEAARPADADLAWRDEKAELERLRNLALRWSIRSAELAVRRYEIEEALATLEHALELGGPTDRQVELWHALGRAHGLRFDGEGFWTAMTRAVELSVDDAVRAEVTSELALDTFVRSGMWTKWPVPDRAHGWIEEALALAGPGSPARVRALTALAFSDPEAHAGAAEEASAVAERLGDAELRAVALDARQLVARDAGDYEEAFRLGQARLELLDEIDDPDLRSDILQTPVVAGVATGRFEEARQLARRNDEETAPLTPHHRVHGVSILVEVEELLGNWEAIRSLEERVVDAVEANSETPCLRNARSLLVCAVAATCLGDDEQARRLERAADALGLPGRHVVDSPRLRLALVRGDRARAAEVLGRLADVRSWYGRGHQTSLATSTTRLDGLVFLGREEEVEQLAARLLTRGPYLEPFALRALGLVRRDSELLERAVASFEALGLGWHAARTRAGGL